MSYISIPRKHRNKPRCPSGCCYWTGRVWCSIEAINQYRDHKTDDSRECPKTGHRLLPGGKVGEVQP